MLLPIPVPLAPAPMPIRQAAPHDGFRAASPALPVGWNDEMITLSSWRDLGGNRPQSWLREGGGLALRLPQVPDGWPYQYQWGGVTREAIVDLGRYPVLLARVDDVHGYAHLDLEERATDGTPVRGRRTGALTAPGLIRFDLGDEAKNARRLTLRLIVGGPNEGATATYRWVRFVSRETADLIERNPDVRVHFVP